MEPKVNIDPLVPKDHRNIESDTIKSVISSRDIYHPLLFRSHDPLYLDSLNQSAPPASPSDNFNSQFAGPSFDQVQGGHIL